MNLKGARWTLKIHMTEVVIQNLSPKKESCYPK